MSLSATATRFFSTSKDGDSTTSLGSPFQCLTALPEWKIFLISDLNLLWHNHYLSDYAYLVSGHGGLGLVVELGCLSGLFQHLEFYGQWLFLLISKDL